MRLLPLFTVFGLAVSATVALVGCGDGDGDGDDTTCGSGTVLQGGMCVPSSTTTCGDGTVLTDGECVPDGSVICEQGTRFDPTTGTCVVDPSACADGTVLVGGTCVPEDDTLTADLEEAAEPNDGAGAGAFDVPAMGAMITLHGCITPRTGARDADVWAMTASGPTLLELTADGVGGLAAGFVVRDDAIPTLPTYFRAGINLTGDTSRRQVFLPTAGTYLLVMDDSRAILVDEVAGGADTCYFTTVERLALPAATALTVPTQAGTDVGDVRVLTYTADAAGDLLRTVLTTGSPSLSPAFVIMRGDTLVAAPGPIAATATAAALPPQWTEGGLSAGDVLSIVVDHQYNFSPSPTPYRLDSLALSAQALPTDGSSVTITGRRAGSDGTADPSKLSYLYFDVAAAGALVQWNLTSTTPLDLLVVRRNVLTGTTFQVLAAFDALGGTGRTAPFSNELTRFLQPGRYYLLVQNPLSTATAGETFTITSTLTPITPTAITYGVPLTGNALPAGGSGFHTIDFTSPTWVELAATATSWGSGNVRVQAYDPAGEGWLGNNYAPAFTGTQPVTGAAPFGRILVGDSRDFILRVSSTATPDPGATYDLTIRDRPHVALGPLTVGTPLVRTGEPVAAASGAVGSQAVTRYLVTGPATASLGVLGTPAAAESSDIVLIRRNVDETEAARANAGLAGVPETMPGVFSIAPQNYVAFTLGSFDTEASTVDLTLTAAAPPYALTAGALPFVDACAPPGAVLPLAGITPSDEGQTGALPLPAGWSFPFLGDAFTQLYVNSNGFMGFVGTPPLCAGTNCSFSNSALPSAATPNALIAPYWDDLTGVQVCRRDDAAAGTVTIQWTGTLFGMAPPIVRTQVVLHQNGTIDLVYGATHQASGASATVGIENLAGTVGQQLLHNQAAIAPSTSYTLTPP